MPYQDFIGFLEDRRGYSDPDFVGLLQNPLPGRMLSTEPDMKGFRANVPGYNTGGYLCDPLADGPLWAAGNPLPSALGSGIIAYGDGVFCTILSSAANTVLQRLDLRDPTRVWKLIAMPSAQEWRSLASNGKGTFVCIAGNSVTSNVYAVSFDNGLTWLQSTMPTSNFYYTLEYGGGIFLALSYGTTNGYYSPTGAPGSWVAITMPASNWRGAATNGRGVWAAKRDNNSTISVSNDNAQTWAQTVATALGTQTMGFGGDYFFHSDGSNLWVARDPNVSWIQRALPIANVSSAEYYKGTFYGFSSLTTQVVSVPGDVTGGGSGSICRNLMSSPVAFQAVKAGGGFLVGVQILATSTMIGIL